MEIEIEPNLNCEGSPQYFFSELGRPRPIRGIRIEREGREVLCDVTGVGKGGQWIPAHAVKVTDSGGGFAYLIFGGEWGIRLGARTRGAWNLTDERQWGEPFKLYGEEKDILYES